MYRVELSRVGIRYICTSLILSTAHISSSETGFSNPRISVINRWSAWSEYNQLSISPASAHLNSRHHHQPCGISPYSPITKVKETIHNVDQISPRGQARQTISYSSSAKGEDPIKYPPDSGRDSRSSGSSSMVNLLSIHLHPLRQRGVHRADGSHPLDTIKVRMQLSRSRKLRGVSYPIFMLIRHEI